ncbi:MAG TPA: type II secretion system protein [Pseudogracilibacillus sp.]|nr:type II secretion system protein [Pseudogracilibacillus sp.]
MNSKKIKEGNGFTLVEVLASIVIISIIFLGVMQLIHFTNKTAVSNNTKLVTTHLAKATMERIKLTPEEFFPTNNVTVKTYDKHNCEVENCSNLYSFKVNDNDYDVRVAVSQQEEEKQLNLINVVVYVQSQVKGEESMVEGYVTQ